MKADFNEKLFIKEEYYLDQKANEVRKNTVLSRKKLSEKLSLEKLKDIIFNEELLIFISSIQTQNRSELEPISQEEIQMKWESDYKNNISLNDEAILEDFPNGYCFFPELWSIKYGKKLLVLYYNH